VHFLALRYAYTYNEGKLSDTPKHPHIMIGLQICQLPDERLTHLEVYAILAVTVTSLENNEPPRATETVPVMVISSFGNMKARVLVAYFASDELIIQKTSLLDFEDDTAAKVNMTFIMRYMASTATEGFETTDDTATVSRAEEQQRRKLADILQWKQSTLNMEEPAPPATSGHTWSKFSLSKFSLRPFRSMHAGSSTARSLSSHDHTPRPPLCTAMFTFSKPEGENSDSDFVINTAPGIP
jgi:hypothetical protein